MNYAIIGCGKFGKIHLKTLLEMNKNVKYVCNKTDSKFKEIQDEYCINGKGEDIQFITDYSIVLNDPDINIVVITTGPHQHYELTKKALEANKHVICEKPFVFSIEQNKELYEIAKSKRLDLFVNYSDIFTPTLIGNKFYELVRKVINDKEPIGIFYQHFNYGPIREDNYSPIWDYGSHAAAFAFECGFNQVGITQVFRFCDSLQGYITRFIHSENKNAILHCQYGNAFSSKQKGIMVSFPSKYIDNTRNGISTYAIDLKDQKTLNHLYLEIEDKILNEADDYDSRINYYLYISNYAINICLHIESFNNDKTLQNENIPT